jgi:hypothetical protein
MIGAAGGNDSPLERPDVGHEVLLIPNGYQVFEGAVERAFITCFKNLFATFPATVPPNELNLPPATTILVFASTAV